MLRFLRKYQVFFYLVVTGIIVIVFTFFGVGSSHYRQVEKPQDREIAKKADGSPLMLSEVKALSHFLNAYPNIFNDGILAKDFLESGIGQLLAEEYFEDVQKDFARQALKSKQTVFYEHPFAKFISARKVWQEFKPEINQNIDRLQAAGQVNFETFEVMSQLFLAQNDFTPDHLKRVLLYQQSQYPQINIDHNLYYTDLSLFGCKTPADWFGQGFLDLVSQFIINAAAIAKEKGYKVSDGEAYSDLLLSAKKGLGALSGDLRQRLAVDGNFFDNQLRYLGLSRKEAVKLWQTVLLFRKYFNDVGGSVLIDGHAMSALQDSNVKKAKINLYELPQFLRLKNFEELLLLQLYIQSVSNEKGLDLPEQYLSLEEIGVKFPRLIQKTYEVESATAFFEEIGLKITEKDLWKWQTENSNWQKILDEFVQICLYKGDDPFSIMEQLPDNLRLKVDSFSRECMVAQNPQMVADYLSRIDPVKEKLIIRANAPDPKWKGIDDISGFCDALETHGSLTNYTQDGKHFYNIKLIKKPETNELATFEDVLRDQLLGEELNLLLRAEFNRLKATVYQDFKSDFEEEKEKVARHVFADFFAQMDDLLNRQAFGFAKEKPVAYYLAYRCFPFMEGFKLAKRSPSQWSPQKRELQISQDEEDLWLKEALSSMEETHSDLHVDVKKKNIRYYKTLEVSADKERIALSMESSRKILVNDAKVGLARRVCDRLKEASCVMLDAILKEDAPAYEEE